MLNLLSWTGVVMRGRVSRNGGQEMLNFLAKHRKLIKITLDIMSV